MPKIETETMNSKMNRLPKKLHTDLTKRKQLAIVHFLISDKNNPYTAGISDKTTSHKPRWCFSHTYKTWTEKMKIITQFKCCLGSNKRINGDILFLVRHLMPRSCLMWDRDNTPENTGAIGAPPLLSLRQHKKIISLHAEIKCVYLDICTQAAGWM